MFDPERLLGSLLTAGLGDGLGGGRGHRRLKKQVKRAVFSPQGLLLLTGVGMAAWEHMQQKKGTAAPVAGTGPLTPPPLPPQAYGPAGGGAAAGPAPHTQGQLMALVAAMAAAAKADGAVDEAERARILARLQDAGAGPDELAHLEAELARPLDVERLVAMAETPVLAAEMYAASVAAIDADTPAEHGYLSLLAARLGLSAELVDEIHRRVAAARAEDQEGTQS